MTKKIFTIYDSKAAAYLQPFFMSTRGEATRAISDCANDINHNFCKHASDFTLMEIGEFNDQTGQVSSYESHVSIANCLELKTQMEIDTQQLTIGGTD